MAETKFLFIATDFRPKPGGRADYIENLARGLINIGQPTKVLAVVQAQRREQLASLQDLAEWVIPFPVVHDARPKKPIANKWVSLLEILQCVGPRSRRILAKAGYFQGSSDSVARLGKVLAEEKPTVVIFGHSDLRLYPFALFLKERGLPYGILGHGLDFHRASGINDFVRKQVMPGGAKWIAANSRYTKSLFEERGIPSSRIRVVYPPIAAELISRSESLKVAAPSSDELRVVTLCRLETGKGVDIVLKALKILATNGIPFRYTIGGDGAERASLETLADKLELRSKVHFVGYATGDDKSRLLASGDVFAQASRPEPNWVEGFGISFIEAAAFGLPAVATREAGIPEAVLDGKTGILVPPDSPSAVADALTFLYRNPEVRKQMGEAARERARSQFTPAAVAAHFLEEVSQCA